jgi:hypothetical protein
LNWLQKIKETGANVPVLDNMPLVMPYARWAWDAFWRLSAVRPINEQGPQPILISEILAFCELTGITEAGYRDDLLHIVLTLDRMFIDHAIRRREEARRRRSQTGAGAFRRRIGQRR